MVTSVTSGTPPRDGAPRRVLIVDDSLTVRRLLMHVISQDSRLQVVGTASDAYEAREKIKTCAPDVLTLDVEMPRMSGLDFLERLMRLRPIPVVMFSSLTSAGSDAAVRALALGAIDCLPKPSAADTGYNWDDLRNRLFAAANSLARTSLFETPAEPFSVGPRSPGGLVMIGASTGGVTAIETILSALPTNWSPVIIAQHMPSHFLRSFAKRLNASFPHDVRLAEDGMPLLPGQVVLAPGEARHCGVFRGSQRWHCRLLDDDRRKGFHPSIDAMFESATKAAPHVTAVMLTGLGDDGAAGMKALYDGGAHCIVQDEATSVVYGMPGAALKIGAASVQLPLQNIASEICRHRPSVAQAQAVQLSRPPLRGEL